MHISCQRYQPSGIPPHPCHSAVPEWGGGGGGGDYGQGFPDVVENLEAFQEAFGLKT